MPGPMERQPGDSSVNPQDVARTASLERENEALREQLIDLQTLLQVKDTEIAFKYHLLQAKDRENASARSRVQWLEVAIQSASAALAVATASLGPERSANERFKAAVEGADCAAPKTPQRAVPKTPGSAAPSAPPSAAPSPSAAAGTPGNRRKGRGGSASGRSALTTPSEAPSGPRAATGATATGASSTTSSPNRRQPQPLDDLGVDEVGIVQRTAPPQEPPPAPPPATDKGTPRKKPLPCASPSTSKRRPFEDLSPANSPLVNTPVATPSKRLAIVDPSSGKEIEVLPKTESSRVKPTLVSMDTFSEPRPGRPLAESPTSLPPQGATLGTVLAAYAPAVAPLVPVGVLGAPAGAPGLGRHPPSFPSAFMGLGMTGPPPVNLLFPLPWPPQGLAPDGRGPPAGLPPAFAAPPASALFGASGWPPPPPGMLPTPPPLFPPAHTSQVQMARGVLAMGGRDVVPPPLAALGMNGLGPIGPPGQLPLQGALGTGMPPCPLGAPCGPMPPMPGGGGQPPSPPLHAAAFAGHSPFGGPLAFAPSLLGYGGCGLPLPLTGTSAPAPTAPPSRALIEKPPGV